MAGDDAVHDGAAVVVHGVAIGIALGIIRVCDGRVSIGQCGDDCGETRLQVAVRTQDAGGAAVDASDCAAGQVDRISCSLAVAGDAAVEAGCL